MTSILVGTAYGQVLGLPLEVPKPKQKITKNGIMKKQRITSIVLQPWSQFQSSFCYSSQKHIFQSCIDNSQNTLYTNYNNKNKIIGIHQFNQQSILAAFNNGSLVEIKRQGLMEDQGDQFKCNKNYSSQEILPAKIQAETNKCYKRIISDKHTSFVLVGKQVLPFLYDSSKNLISWTGKNVPNDELDLRVPVNDVDATFFKNSSSIACAHASNKIRIYDVRSNKQKPSSDYHLKLDKVYNKSYLTKISTNKQNQNIFYVGNDIGAIYACDIRKQMQVVGKFKDINSTITDIKTFDNKLYTTSLDCYVRSFDLQSYELLDKHYMNKELYSLEIVQSLIEKPQQYEQQALSQAEEQQLNPIQEAQSKKMKKLRKRNKVNLKYLKPINWDDVPIAEQLLQQAKEQYEQINQKDADSYLDQEPEELKIKNQHQSDSDLD